MKRANYKPSTRSGKSPEEQYFDSLYRAYKNIPAIGGIGTLPVLNTSVVRNKRGDVVLTYYDYGTPQQQYVAALNIVEDYTNSNDPYMVGYWSTILYIASGKKIVWKTKYKGGQLISRGADAILHNSNEERKQRISYLGTAAKGALSLDMMAHNIWQGHTTLDDRDIYDGVENAILECTSVKDAKNKILDEYLTTSTQEEKNYGELLDEEYLLDDKNELF